MPKHQLGSSSTHALFDAVACRKSSRDFSGMALSHERLSALLKYSCGITSDEKDTRRAQPSGGARYPIETYALLFVGNERVPSGVYHYAVKEHALESLWERSFPKSDIASLFTYPWAQQAALALVLTGVFDRNQRKYGERGYRQILIEAGAIVQNIYLCSAALQMKCCAIDGVHENAIERLLDIDGVNESAIVSILLG